VSPQTRPRRARPARRLAAVRPGRPPSPRWRPRFEGQPGVTARPGSRGRGQVMTWPHRTVHGHVGAQLTWYDQLAFTSSRGCVKRSDKQRTATPTAAPTAGGLLVSTARRGIAEMCTLVGPAGKLTAAVWVRQAGSGLGGPRDELPPRVAAWVASRPAPGRRSSPRRTGAGAVAAVYDVRGIMADPSSPRRHGDQWTTAGSLRMQNVPFGCRATHGPGFRSPGAPHGAETRTLALTELGCHSRLARLSADGWSDAHRAVRPQETARPLRQGGGNQRRGRGNQRPGGRNAVARREQGPTRGTPPWTSSRYRYAVPVQVRVNALEGTAEWKRIERRGIWSDILGKGKGRGMQKRGQRRRSNVHEIAHLSRQEDRVGAAVYRDRCMA